MPTTNDGRVLPDAGGILGGLPHPLENEIRRKEPRETVYYRCPGAKKDEISERLINDP